MGDGHVDSFEEARQTPYPAIHVREGRRSRLTTVRSEGSGKTVEVLAIPEIAHPDHIAERAFDAAANGARVLVIRNTVRDCVATQLALERLANERGKADLLLRCKGVAAPHHARFARGDRMLLDDAIEVALGKVDAAAAG